MFIVILIYVLVRYGQQLAPEQNKLLALLGLILTILYVAGVLGGWHGWPAR